MSPRFTALIVNSLEFEFTFSHGPLTSPVVCCSPPLPPRRSCISYPTNQRQMNCTSCRNIFVLPKALPQKTDAGTRLCAPVLEV